MPIDTQQPAIRAFTRFLRRDLKGSIVRAARRHQILSEADLQTFCCLRISRWIKRRDYQRVFRVTNKQFLVESGTYPDIVVFRKDRPWAVIELKEQRLLKISVEMEEANKLKAIRVSYESILRKMAPSTYIIYLERKLLKG